MPVKGWAMPQIRFWSAIPKAKVSRPHWRSVVTGWRNSPKVWRIPSEKRRIAAPQQSATSAVPHPVLDGCADEDGIYPLLAVVFGIMSAI